MIHSIELLNADALNDHETSVDEIQEAGGVAIFFIGLAVALVAMIGLTFDAGRVLAARREAFDVAHQAAIAGTQGLDEATVRTGNFRLGNRGVNTMVNNFLAGQDDYNGGLVSAGQSQVTVEVQGQVDMQILSIVGVKSQTVTGVATARASRGVTGADQ